MPYINIDLDEIYDDLTSSEKRKLAEWLTDDGYMDADVDILELDYPPTAGIEDEDVVRSLLNIIRNRISLSNEERELVKGIGGRV